jgi:hydroxyethylthiazole kinase-like uncharacterized protein yjeF
MNHRVASVDQVRAMDAHTIETVGVSSLALMEIAGRAVAAETIRWVRQEGASEVLVFAGPGNNGGDGYVVARHLHLAGVAVQVVAVSGGHSPDCLANREAAVALGIAITETVPEVDSDAGRNALVVDALLGTGTRDDLRGEILTRVQQINALQQPVLAVDMPTGVCGETGRVLGDAVDAVCTVTIGRAKPGAFGTPGGERVGELVVADIGLVDEGQDPAALVVDGAWVGERIPARDAASHKGSHGHLGVIAGSVEKAGAAVLVCNAAIRSGCGLVTLLVHPEAASRLSNLRDEVMVQTSERIEPQDLTAFDAIAAGPGFGVGEEAAKCLMRLWHEVPAPGIFDADALTALASDPKPSNHPRCISPHPGEAARLLGLETAAVQSDRFSAVRALSEWGPALLKGRHTLVCGETLTINRTGTPALATAGTGDVLTGVVGALLAQGLSPTNALVCGAFVHGLAGELAGQSPIVAGDVISALPEAFRSVGLRLDMVGFRPLLG